MTTTHSVDVALDVSLSANEPTAWFSPEKQTFTTLCWEFELWLAYGLEVIEVPNLELAHPCG